MNIIIKIDNKILTLEEALKNQLILIKNTSIRPINDHIKICPSANLFDINNNEIFLDDTIEDINTKIKYKVIQFYCTFYLKQLDSYTGCVLDTLTNFKLGNQIPFIKL